MAVRYAAGATLFADYLTGVKARLVSVLTVPADPDPLPVDETYVRVLVSRAMTPEGSEYRAEPGVTVRVGAAQPQVNCGAGRAGWLTVREIEVWVVTESLLDPGGDDLIAIKAHLSQEEVVLNALVDTPPTDRDPRTRLGVRITWVPGGAAPHRRDDTDQGIVASSLKFRCEYQANLQVDRQ